MSPPAPDASVVVVTHQSEGVVARCLSSVASSVGPGTLEVLVVDNASTDRSRDLAAAAGATVVALDRNLGFAAAANRGLALARGRHVVLLNPDAFPDPGAISALLRRLDATPAAGIVGAALRYPSGALQPSAGRMPSLRGALWLALGLHRTPLARRREVALLAHPRHYRSPRRVDWVTGAFCAARREIGPLPEAGFMYGEDVEWARQAAQAGHEVWVEPAARAVHGVAASSRGTAAGASQRLRVAFDDRWFARRGRAAVLAARGVALLHGGLRWTVFAGLGAIGVRSSGPSREGAALVRAAIARPGRPT
ncbi:MAG TPA: glycosyltransferase family 2 protein [Solirubrobacteraceae bacterium]|nr:glycosyltransferase family 2 protein [Solirubrobacteraceae bacterium]